MSYRSHTMPANRRSEASNNVTWKSNLISKSANLESASNFKMTVALRKSIEILSKTKLPYYPSATLPGQPFDSHLLLLSRLYASSRDLYVSIPGKLSPSFISSGRTLSSPALLTNHIEYSPIESELIWAATDPLEKKHEQSILRLPLLQLRSYSVNVFHEQNHRIISRLVPAPQGDRNSLRQYLNFSESLAIIADMALGDELGPDLSSLFYRAGVIFHSGADIHPGFHTKEKYRDYLHAAQYATFLNLEGWQLSKVQQIIPALFPKLKKFNKHVVNRAFKLNRAFVEKTNPLWQKRHEKLINKYGGQKPNIDGTPDRELKPYFQLLGDPLDIKIFKIWTEKWMNLIKL